MPRGAGPLSAVPLLADVDPGTLCALESDATTRRLLAGEWLFRAGDPADELFVVLGGRLRVSVDDGAGEREVNELGPGAAVGELALLTGSRRSASVRAVRDTTLLTLPGATFAAHLARDPGLGSGIARALAAQLQERGGLPLPASRPTLIAVRGVAPGLPITALGSALGRALAAFGPVEVMHQGVAEEIERAEDASAHVVLVDDGGDAEWSALCARQADRTLLVAAAGVRPAAVAPGADLVALGPFAGGELRSLIDAVAPRTHHRLASTEPEDPGVGRLARHVVGRALGVVLSGGGARGLAHIGVLEVLEEEGIAVDSVGGCSMGSLIAAMAAAGWSPRMIRDRCHEELVQRSPFNDYTLPRVALIRSRKAARMLNRLFEELTIEELQRPFFAVSADLLSSEVVVHRSGSVIEAVGASMSIPGLAAPLPRGGRLLVDGGVLNNLPVDAMAETHEGPILAVDVIRRVDAGGPAEPELPSIVETLSRATVLGSVERAEANRGLAVLVVMPDVQDVALREFRALDRAIEAGRRAAREALAAGGLEAIRAAITGPAGAATARMAVTAR